MKDSLQSDWLTFRDQVLTEETRNDNRQVALARRCFFAGAASMESLLYVATKDPTPEAAIDSLQAELDAFKQECVEEMMRDRRERN